MPPICRQRDRLSGWAAPFEPRVEGAPGTRVVLARQLVQVGETVLDVEVAWWRHDDLWMWALDASVVYVRAAADGAGIPIAVAATGSRSARR